MREVLADAASQMTPTSAATSPLPERQVGRRDLVRNPSDVSRETSGVGKLGPRPRLGRQEAAMRSAPGIGDQGTTCARSMTHGSVRKEGAARSVVTDPRALRVLTPDMREWEPSQADRSTLPRRSSYGGRRASAPGWKFRLTARLDYRRLCEAGATVAPPATGATSSWSMRALPLQGSLV